MSTPNFTFRTPNNTASLTGGHCLWIKTDQLKLRMKTNYVMHTFPYP